MSRAVRSSVVGITVLAVAGGCDSGVRRGADPWGPSTGGVVGTGNTAVHPATGGSPVPMVTSSCPDERGIDAPSPSTVCVATNREIDQDSNCGGEPCAITRAIDLFCNDRPQRPGIVATPNGATVSA
jgi:hypothetical protein